MAGLSRPSTSCCGIKDVDARQRRQVYAVWASLTTVAGHDERGRANLSKKKRCRAYPDSTGTGLALARCAKTTCGQGQATWLEQRCSTAPSRLRSNHVATVP